MTSPQTVVTGTVIHGDKIGRTLGFPTANLDAQLDPASLAPGVYVARCQIGTSHRQIWGLAYFGPRLVMGEQHHIFEVYLYDFNEEVYGKKLSAELITHTRQPLPFTSLEDLRIQLEKDKREGWDIIRQLPMGPSYA
jgi:riboflavin kinase / FMN adenylyltransferase